MVICDYCKQPATLVRGCVPYPHRPDLHPLFYWWCGPCEAWVGTHVHSPEHEPYGRLANGELRAWKIKAHDAFDALWREFGMSRNTAYAWLAAQLDLVVSECHIGKFDVAQCKRVCIVCGEFAARRNALKSKMVQKSRRAAAYYKGLAGLRNGDTT